MENHINKAKSLSRQAHEGQRDKLGLPYFKHPESVATILTFSPAYKKLSPEDKETALQTAWLHDVVEDTAFSLDDLREMGFSESVVHNVGLMTFDRKESREAYYKKILTSEIARSVKIADLVHNTMDNRLKELPEDDQKRLVDKYTKSISILLKPEEAEWFHQMNGNTLN
jgi:(p)ppGpp synthase/HD superfamily hydrolase